MLDHEIKRSGNFIPCNTGNTTMLNAVTGKVKALTTELLTDNKITSDDRELICGLNANGRMKHSPEFQAKDPHVEPLFKLHKLTENEINDKKIPPLRLVSSARNGPLYRLEKWISPHLTTLSQEYLGDEYVRDTPDLTNHLESLNYDVKCDDYNLFTLDVVQLYPSINPHLCRDAIDDALRTSQKTSDNMKTTLSKMSDLILSNSYVHYDNEDHQIDKGIATGGCTSRQKADIFMKWLFSNHVNPLLPYWDELIKLWKRFIDDILGLWKGPESSFRKFILDLNELTQPFGIKFDGEQFGKEVTFLDINVYFDENNKLQHKLHIKPTDSRRYLNTNSYHDPAVFKSVPLSQIIRVSNRNSVPKNRAEDIEQLKNDLMKSGYTPKQCQLAEHKANLKLNSNTAQQTNKGPAIILSTKYFSATKQLRSLLHNITEDLRTVTGENQLRPILANKRGPNIGDKITKNKELCSEDRLSDLQILFSSEMQQHQNQKCNTKRCKSCCLFVESSTFVEAGGFSHVLPRNLTCKSRNIVYIFQCKLCHNSRGSYVGQTQQPCHKRVNNHRSTFRRNPENSPLAYHSVHDHGGTLKFEDFNLSILEQTDPRNLNKLENYYISKFRCRTLGLNRCDIILH